jgi:hypothetical protein
VLRSFLGIATIALGSASVAGCSHDLTFLAVGDASSAQDAAPDDALACSSPADQQACDPVRNCNCASGQTCAAPDLDQRRSRCVRVGASTEGTSCIGPGECSAGLSCVRFTCRRSCRSRRDCQGGELCVTDDPRGVVGVCARSNECMINPSSGCAGGVHCRPETLTLVGESGSAGLAWCEELEGTGTDGADCESAGCGRGLVCESVGGGFRCARPCTQGSQCTTAGRARCDLTSSPVLIDSVVWGQCAP